MGTVTLEDWIVMGSIAGAIAHAITPGAKALAVARSMVLGVLGGVLGGGAANYVRGVPLTTNDTTSWLASIALALIVVVVGSLPSFTKPARRQ